MNGCRSLVLVLLAGIPTQAWAQWEDPAEVDEPVMEEDFVSDADAMQIDTDDSAPPPSAAASRMAVGAATMAGALAGPSFVYDKNDWRVDAILSWRLVKDLPDTLAIGGRFYYVVKSSAQADLSLGGGLAFLRQGGPAGVDAETGVLLEVGAQIRVFLVRQVALTGTFGAAVGLAAVDYVEFRGDPVGGLGIVYYFR